MCSQIISTVKIPLYNSLLQPETNRHICERGFALFNSKGNFFFQTAVYLFRLPRLLTGAGIGPAQQRSISKLEVTVQLRRASRPFIRLRGKQHIGYLRCVALFFGTRPTFSHLVPKGRFYSARR